MNPANDEVDQQENQLEREIEEGLAPSRSLATSNQYEGKPV